MCSANELYLEQQVEDLPHLDDEIQNFVTPRRMDILCALESCVRLSQGELAQHVNMKPTALANHLLKFDNFRPKLLEKVNEGKYCYYTLSEQGQRFLKQNRDAAAPRIRKSTALLDRQDELLFASAETSVVELKRQFGDEWGKVFDDVLVHYTLGSSVVPNDGATKLVNQYLRSFELLIMHQNEQVYSKMLSLLEEGTNRSRVTEFIDGFFVPFSIVLKKIQEKDQLFSVGAVLEFVFTGDRKETMKAHLQALNWDSNTIQTLQETVKQIKRRISGFGQQGIYDYFTVLLPDQEAWAWTVSRWI